MSTATVDQWKIVRWKWQRVQRIEGKAGTRFILRRKGCLHCSADWIGYNESFCFASWYFSIGQTTTRRHCPSCVTTRCNCEGPGSLEQTVNISWFAWPDCRGAALHLLIIPRHTNVIQTLHNWLHSSGTAVEYSVHQTLPSVRKWAGSRD